jgi:hypothetical protein
MNRRPLSGSLLSAERSTRRDALRRIGSAGMLATVSAGLLDLLGAIPAGASTATSSQLPATMVLNALGPNAPAGLSVAIQSGCCVHYTRDEGACGSPCPSGSCCYHVTSTTCGLDSTGCVDVNCAEGNFTTGC